MKHSMLKSREFLFLSWNLPENALFLGIEVLIYMVYDKVLYIGYKLVLQGGIKFTVSFLKMDLLLFLRT